MNLHRALSDIAEIRQQLDRTETYRGFRSAAVGISVLFLLLGAWAEQQYVAEPTVEVDRFLSIWLAVAIASALAAAVEMLVRGQVSGNRLVWKMHRSLVRQIVPSLAVGFVLTLLIASHALDAPSTGDGLMWALPGIWSMVYGLGLFSCEKHLPESALGVAIYFVCAGALVLGYGWLTRELAAWQMIATFGVGQAFLGIVLFWNLEKRRG